MRALNRSRIREGMAGTEGPHGTQTPPAAKTMGRDCREMGRDCREMSSPSAATLPLPTHQPWGETSSGQQKSTTGLPGMREWRHPVCLSGQEPEQRDSRRIRKCPPRCSLNLLLKAALGGRCPLEQRVPLTPVGCQRGKGRGAAVTQSAALTARAKSPLHALSEGKYSSEQKGYTGELKTPQLQHRAGAELVPALQRALATLCIDAQPRHPPVGSLMWSHRRSTSQPPFPWTPCLSVGCSRSSRWCVPPGSCSGTGWPPPHPYPRCPHTGWGSTPEHKQYGGLLQKHQDTKQLCEDRATSLQSPPSAAGPCSQCLDTAQQFSLLFKALDRAPPCQLQGPGQHFLPLQEGGARHRGWQEHLHASTAGREPSMPNSSPAGPFLSRWVQGSVGHLPFIPAGPAERSRIPLNISITGSRAGMEPHS